MDKLKSIKIKYQDGTYSDEIPIGVSVENVDYNDTKTLKQVLNLDVTKGTVEERLNKQSNDISSMSATVNNANENASAASTKADAVDARLDNIIVESGTSDAETIAARTNSNTGITYTTLDQRLDAENSEIKEDLIEVEGGYYSALAKYATVIPNGTDLDTLTTAGNYKVTSVANAQTIINLPLVVAFALKVVELSFNKRLMQVLYPQGVKMPVYRRYYDGSVWYPWELDAKVSQLIDLTNVILTTDNYTTYFPNALFADAKPNTIYGIYDSTLFSDAPIGDDWIGTSGRTSGRLRGTLMTFSQANSHDKVQTGLTQIFVGYRDTNYSPTLSYRIAIVSNGVYTWSDWSKFEENGYLHASNMVVYGGSYDKTFSDLNDAPNNSIVQIDLNNDNTDAAHTLGNHPAPGVSCVMMTYAFSYTTMHGKVQTLFTIDGRMYWRYGYQQAPGDYRWKTWWLVNADIPKIPNAPDADGTYTLVCTVSNGVKTYSWQTV